MTSVSDGATWDFAMECMDKSDIQPLDVFSFDTIAESDRQYLEDYFEGVQSVLEGFS